MRQTPNSMQATEYAKPWGAFFVFLNPSLSWAGIFFKLMHAVKTLQTQVVWEWTAEWRDPPCLREISVSKIHKKTWIPKWRSWTHTCGLLPGAIKAAIQFLLLTPQEPKSWKKKHWMGREERRIHTLAFPSSATFLCHRSLVSLELPPIHRDPHVLLHSL